MSSSAVGSSTSDSCTPSGLGIRAIFGIVALGIVLIIIGATWFFKRKELRNWYSDWRRDVEERRRIDSDIMCIFSNINCLILTMH